jgi:hypothetical protein
MEGNKKCCIPIKDGIPEWSLLPRTTKEHVPYLVCERPRLRICRKADLGDRATETEGDYFPFVLTLLDLRRHKRAICHLSLLLGSVDAGAAGLSEAHQPPNTTQSRGKWQEGRKEKLTFARFN